MTYVHIQGVQLKSGPYFNMSNLFTKFNIHGTVHRSMTSSNNQRDAA